MLRLAATTLGRSAASSSRTALGAARPSFVNQTRIALPSLATQSRGYHEKVIDHYENPRNVSCFNLDVSMDATGVIWEMKEQERSSNGTCDAMIQWND